MTFELDPEKRLYVPGRRRFFFMGGLALAGTLVKGWAQAPGRFRVLSYLGAASSDDLGRAALTLWAFNQTARARGLPQVSFLDLVSP